MTVHVPRPDIDESDPLGLGELRIGTSPPPPASNTAVTLPESRTESASDAIDLADIAAMARRVEDARFAAERQLHYSLRIPPSPPPTTSASFPPAHAVPVAAPRPRPSIDPVVRRMAAQAEQTASQLAQMPMAPAPRIPDRSEPRQHTENAAAAASAALRDLLANVDRPAAPPAADTVAIPQTPTASGPASRPNRLRPAEPRPERETGGHPADTASLLRELASLSDPDEAAPINPAPTTGPRPTIRPPTPAAPVNRARRKGLFAR